MTIDDLKDMMLFNELRNNITRELNVKLYTSSEGKKVLITPDTFYEKLYRTISEVLIVVQWKNSVQEKMFTTKKLYSIEDQMKIVENELRDIIIYQVWSARKRSGYYNKESPKAKQTRIDPKDVELSFIEAFF